MTEEKRAELYTAQVGSYSSGYSPKGTGALALYAKRTEAVPLYQIRWRALCRGRNRQASSREGLDGDATSIGRLINAGSG